MFSVMSLSTNVAEIPWRTCKAAGLTLKRYAMSNTLHTTFLFSWQDAILIDLSVFFLSFCSYFSFSFASQFPLVLAAVRTGYIRLAACVASRDRRPEGLLVIVTSAMLALT